MILSTREHYDWWANEYEIMRIQVELIIDFLTLEISFSRNRKLFIKLSIFNEKFIWFTWTLVFSSNVFHMTWQNCLVNDRKSLEQSHQEFLLDQKRIEKRGRWRSLFFTRRKTTDVQWQRWNEKNLLPRFNKLDTRQRILNDFLWLSGC